MAMSSSACSLNIFSPPLQVLEILMKQLAGGLLLAVLICSKVAMAAPPSVERLEPAAGQRGTTFMLTVTGAGLQSATEVLLYGHGLRCDDLRPISNNSLEIVLTAEADLPPGPRAFRLRSPEGLSELITFQLSTLPVITETEDNNSPDNAQTVPLNSTVAGVITAADADCFQLTLNKGQRLSVEAEAMRAGGAMFDAVLNLYGPDGTWLEAIDDTPLTRQDPWFTFKAPEAGTYVVQIHEASFEGDESCRYALHIGDFERPATVWPLGGPAGSDITVSWMTTDGSAFNQTLQLPPTPGQTISLRPAHASSDSPVGVPFRISAGLNHNEDAAPPAATIQLPVAFNGRLSTPDETDVWRFQATAGERVRIEVWAARLGSSADTLLDVRTPDGRLLAAGDDEESHDTAVTVLIPASGEYEVRIREKRGRGGDECFYRIEAETARPSVTAFISRPDRRTQERQAVAVPQGNRVVTFLSVQRKGFSGEASLAASGLPAGVELHGALIPQDRFWVPIVMQAAQDAPVGASLATIEAAGKDGDRIVSGQFRQRVDLVAASADQLFHAAEVDRLAVAVTEPVPYSADLQPPQTPLAVNGTLALQVHVQRQPGFDGPLEVSFPFLPPWTDGPDKLLIPAGETSGVYVIRAWAQAEPRTWLLCAEVRPALGNTSDGQPGVPREPGASRSRQATVSTVRTAVSTALVPVTIAASPVQAKPLRIVTEQGKSVTAAVRPIVGGQLPELLTAQLEGLPNRVSAAAVTWDGKRPEITFNIQPEDSAPTGEFTDVQVRLSGVLDGQAVSWLVAGGTVLQVEQPGGVQLDDTGRPLSRLEKLRRAAETNQ
jgi:hypothetical protein